jgi:hypothetical protein
MLNATLNVHVPPVAFVRAEAAGALPRFASEARQDPARFDPFNSESAKPELFKTEPSPHLPPVVVYPTSQARAEQPVVAEPEEEIALDADFDRLKFNPRETLEFEPAVADRPVALEQPVMVAASRDQRVFSGTLDLLDDQNEREDLDVPAFLRRGGL